MFLNNQQVTEEIRREVKKFPETNDNENTTTQNLWDAAEAVLRETSRTLFSLTSQASYQVLLTSPCTIRLHGIDAWIQGTHLEKALDPGWSSTWSGALK